MNLSGRTTAISNESRPRQYLLFDTATVAEREWRIAGIRQEMVAGQRQLLTWHESGASTSKATLPPNFEIPAGLFTADLELFVLSGAIQIGQWVLDKHSYAFIPAGVNIGPWKVLGSENAEVLWMENGPVPFSFEAANGDRPDARLSDYIPVLDSKLMPWGNADTVQFETSKKKWLRTDRNGGGTWLLAILPHYDGGHAMIQAYNEESYGLFGYCDIGEYRFSRDHFSYCPNFSTVPRHRTEEGGLFLVRVGRDLSQVGAVSSYNER